MHRGIHGCCLDDSVVNKGVVDQYVNVLVDWQSNEPQISDSN